MDVMGLVTQLRIAKDFYYKGKPIMTDPEFDALENKLREINPSHDYFKSVGTPAARGQKVKHTIPMGSLDQVDNSEDINRWVKRYKLDDHLFVLSDKLDGNSIAVYYGEDGEFVKAVTRGDGIEGLDITRHINRMFNRNRAHPFPKVLPISSPAVVRCEAIIAKEDFEKYIVGYKNPRNYVAGQLNRAVAEEKFIKHARFVAFDLNIEDNNISKIVSLQLLKTHRFDVVNYTQTNSLSMDFETELNKRKQLSPYELDGIVIDVNNCGTREDLGFDNLNPNYARKFKINVNFIETEVIEVQWNPSKNGYLKPRVQFEPVDLAGVTISFATGFNAKFIQDNKIGPGAIIRVTRSGDVIPFIESVVTPAKEAMMPNFDKSEFYWSETGVDMILNELPAESIIKDMVDFFTGIDVPMLKIGNVTSLYEAGFITIESIINASEDEMLVVLGENGIKAYNGLKKLQNIPEYILAGSLSFFGRGVGRRKMKALAEMHGDITQLTYDKIMTTAGFDDTTAKKIVEGIPNYVDFLSKVSYNVGREVYIKREGNMSNIVVCFTGVRSKDLEEIIESNGGKIASSVSKDVTHLVAKDPNGKSSKLSKARDRGVKVISLEEAEKLWSN